MSVYADFLEYMGDLIEAKIRPALAGPLLERGEISVIIFDPKDPQGNLDLLITHASLDQLEAVLARARTHKEIREQGYDGGTEDGHAMA